MKLLGRWVDRRRPQSIDVLHANEERTRGAILLDVRESGEWRAGHAHHARHIPLTELPSRLGELPGDRTILTVCRSGRRSAQAAAMLAKNGRDVRHVSGGMSAWVTSGLPVVGPGGRAGRVI